MDDDLSVQPDPNAGEGQGQGSQDDGGQGQYAGYLKGIPEQYHGQLLDGFKRTDGHWQNKLNEAQSQYTPWAPIAERYELPYVQASTAFMDAIQQNPAEVVPWLAREFGVEVAQQAQQQVQGQGQQQWGQDQGGAEDWRTNVQPEVLQRLDRMDEVERLAMTNAQAFMEAQQKQQEVEQRQQLNEEIAEFDRHLGELRTKHGDFDMDWVLAKLGTGEFDSPEKAVHAYKSWEQQVVAAAAQRRVPTLLNSGGGYQSNQVDPASMSAKDTRALVAQIVAQANQDG